MKTMVATLLLGSCAGSGSGKEEASGWSALRSPSENRGTTLFEEISPDDSGIRFEHRYDHPQRWPRLWHQYFLGTFGSGLSLGDVKGDGMADTIAVGKDSPTDCI